VSKRSIFVLDRKGVVRYSWITDDPIVEPPYDKIPEILSEIE
jgi:peroxiredoxin